VENGIACVDCSLAGEHVCMAYRKASAWAEFSAGACCGVVTGGIVVILSIDGACARQIRESPSPLRLAANGGSSEVTIALTEPVRSTRTQLARQFEHTILISFCVVKGTIDSLRDQELE